MDYSVKKENPKLQGVIIKNFSYDKEYWEKHLPWTKQNL